MNVTGQFVTRLESLLGADRVLGSDEALASFAVNGTFPAAVVRPACAEEVAGVVRFAAECKLALIAHGARSKSDIGMPPARYDIAVDMTGLREIAHYDAGDLTLSVDAGMPLRDLATRLAEKRQFLPLAVPCFETSTAGGAVASGIESALRQQYGTARDFLIGAEFVDGKGNLCKSGGRVVNNVSGYDLHKLLIGSLGTLGIITRLNFRTFPLPEVSAGHVASFKSDDEALRYRCALEHAGLPFANVELLSPEVAAIMAAILRREAVAFPEALNGDGWLVYASYDGNAAVVQRISLELEKLVAACDAAASELLGTDANDAVGGMLREAFEWLRWASPATVLFRVPNLYWGSHEFRGLRELAVNASLRCGLLLRAAGILYYAAFGENEDAGTVAALQALSAQVFRQSAAAGVPVTMLHSPALLQSNTNAWSEKRGDFSLMTKIKKAFDPDELFSPGRFVGGI